MQIASCSYNFPIPEQNMTATLSFRPATPEDAPFVAAYVLAAFHIIELETAMLPDSQEKLQTVVPIVQQTGTLYSYKHAELALKDGQAVGMLLCYKGSDYRTLRDRTFAQLPFFTPEELAAMDDECAEGDLYIDSLAVHPDFRGQGIAQALLQRVVEHAREEGLLPTLLVDPDNPKAKVLYEKMGFRAEGRVNAFGVNFFRMVHR